MTFPMSVGASAVLLPDRPTPDAVLDTMQRHQPTIFAGVPTLFASMLANPRIGPGAGSARLRRCISAGEALPADIGRRWSDMVGVDILDGIGSTEMLHIFVSNRADDIRYGTSGKPVPGYEAMILDEHGGRVPNGEAGELVVRGPSAADGYWNQRDKTRRTFRGEWTHTGDTYIRDADGYYRFCGRTDEMLKVSGVWVSPFEVEEALVSHPAVLESAVVGAQDRDGLTKPKAFVVLQEAARQQDAETVKELLKTHVKERIGVWKYPRWIEFVDGLPKTATGKIQRFRLRDDHRPIGFLRRSGGGRIPKPRRRWCCCTRVSAASRCGAIFPPRSRRATGCGVFAYSRFGYGGSDPVTLPRPMRYMHDEALDGAAARARCGRGAAGGADRTFRWRVDRGDPCRRGARSTAARRGDDRGAFLRRGHQHRQHPRHQGDL